MKIPALLRYQLSPEDVQTITNRRLAAIHAQGRPENLPYADKGDPALFLAMAEHYEEVSGVIVTSGGDTIPAQRVRRGDQPGQWQY